MSKYGPSIITDGLEVYLDSQNPNSFPGEPTTNILDDPLDLTTGNWILGNDSGDITITPGQPDPFGGTNAFKFECTDGDGTSEYPHIRQNSAISGTTAQHKFSVYIKSLSGSTTLSLISFRQSPWSSGGGSSNFNITDEWVRYEMTCTPMDTSAHTIDIIQNLANANAQSYLIAFPQVEEKAHVTPFVKGTRLVADGWKDLTGNGHHGQLDNMAYDSNAEMVYSSVVGNYVDTEFIPSFVHNDATQIIWIKYSAFGGGNGCHNSRRFYLGLSSSTVFGWGVCNVNNWSSGASHTISLNEYVMLAVTADNGTARGYINAQDTGVTFAYTKSADFSPNQSYKLGSWTGVDQFLNGTVAVSLLYDRTLTPEELLQNFNALRGRFGI